METFSLPAFEITLESSACAVRGALRQILQGLAPLKLEQEEIDAVELVMAEVLNNVVEHAYPEDSKPKDIKVRCTHEPNGLFIRIVDHGIAMPDGKIPLGALSSNDVALEDLPEGGFGWFLIRHLARDVAYERGTGENRLSLRIAVG
jgi:serine/threonine-protein kinase RsbW